jgi:hypothetical protein
LKGLPWTDTEAYYKHLLNIDAKCFITWGPGASHIKHFLHYNLPTGIISWRVRLGQTFHPGLIFLDKAESLPDEG